MAFPLLKTLSLHLLTERGGFQLHGRAAGERGSIWDRRLPAGREEGMAPCKAPQGVLFWNSVLWTFGKALPYRRVFRSGFFVFDTVVQTRYPFCLVDCLGYNQHCGQDMKILMAYPVLKEAELKDRYQEYHYYSKIGRYFTWGYFQGEDPIFKINLAYFIRRYSPASYTGIFVCFTDCINDILFGYLTGSGMKLPLLTSLRYSTCRMMISGVHFLNGLSRCYLRIQS